jgi:hypothetical protein
MSQPMVTALSAACAREMDAPHYALILESLMGLLGALLAHAECHPTLYANPSGIVLREQVDLAVARFLKRPSGRRGRSRPLQPPR